MIVHSVDELRQRGQDDPLAQWAVAEIERLKDLLRAALTGQDELQRQLAKLETEYDAKAKEVCLLRGVIDGWKAWHRELSDVLGCKFIERNVTKAAVKRLVDRQDPSGAGGGNNE